ncbi:VanZ family protein [Phenylobacterium sp.]|uniref:VanZ family protein n=1 Tax=Phenylobacterium sp. TaxID=1871053 RepID=UPI002FC6909F
MVPSTQNAARFLLIAAGLVCVVGMVGPFQGVEKAFVPADKAAHFIAFYGLTALMMAAFRKNRRLEIALAAALLGGAIEIAQMVVGRGVSLSDLAADAAGAFAVWTPMWLQSLRSAPYEERRAQARDARPAETV